jgi:hypothetical protein
MLTNQFPVQADEQGDLLQRVAHQILLLDACAVVPHDLKQARVLLDKLEREQPRTQPSADGRRFNQFNELRNATLLPLQRAKRLGLRPADAKLPEPSSRGAVTEDELQVLREIAAQIDIDIEAHQALTPEQRRILRLEARIARVVEHNNSLVTALKDQEERIARLEAIIAGPHAA